MFLGRFSKKKIAPLSFIIFTSIPSKRNRELQPRMFGDLSIRQPYPCSIFGSECENRLLYCKHRKVENFPKPDFFQNIPYTLSPPCYRSENEQIYHLFLILCHNHGRLFFPYFLYFTYCEIFSQQENIFIFYIYYFKRSYEQLIVFG